MWYASLTPFIRERIFRVKFCKSVLISVFFLVSLSIVPAAFSDVQPAYDFNLPDIFDESKVYSLEDFKGKVVLINLWASWCTGCKKEMPLFHFIQARYSDKGFTFVAVNIDDDKKNALKFLEKLEKKMDTKLNFPVLYDKDKELAEKYNPLGLPASYLIDRNGDLAQRFIGSFDNSNVINLTLAIDRMLGDDQ